MVADISLLIKKATSSDEGAPKRKHVRACIVYTWDHKTSKPFWQELKVLPLAGDEILMYKAFITIHKVLQEGHPLALRDGYRSRDWIVSQARSFYGDGSRGYGSLIRLYGEYLGAKLEFHHNHHGFNGIFEYEEYVLLRSTSDPNEGYESILDLMQLQDRIDGLQKLVFATLRHLLLSECKISSLVPMVLETYGIYRFLILMMRAMYRMTGEREAIMPLVEMFNEQHARLLDFFQDALSLRYLKTLITIPRLPRTPPNVFVEDDLQDGLEGMPREQMTGADALTSNPTGHSSIQPTRDVTPQPAAVLGQPTGLYAQPTGMAVVTADQQAYEMEQQRLEQQRQQQVYQQQQYAAQQQALFQQQQQQQQEAALRAQHELMVQQQQQQTQGRVAEMERELLALHGQREGDQLMLQLYDQQLKAMESDLAALSASAEQQLASKNELVQNLQEQIAMWKNKYESLAKLYQQLRLEHLTLLSKFKKLQQKAALAEELIASKEKLEKEMKLKNIELADLIRERDRARLELDRLKGGMNSEVSKLEAELREVKSQLAETEHQQLSNLTAVFDAHKRELEQVKRELASSAPSGQVQQLEDQLLTKDAELEAMQEQMEKVLLELLLNQDANDKAVDDQIDEVLAANVEKFKSIVDSILMNSSDRILSALYEVDSPMQAGNQLATPEYLLSLAEACGTTVAGFADSFNNYIADGPSGDYSKIIGTLLDFVGAVCDILLNAKGITRTLGDTETTQLMEAAKGVATSAMEFFIGVELALLELLSEDDRFDVVIDFNIGVQEALQTLVDTAENLGPKSGALSAASGNLSDFVDREMASAAQAIENASARLQLLMALSAEWVGLSEIDLEVNKLILAAAVAITNAIMNLIKAATELQQEIVATGKGSSSKAAFYKKNSRWTEGLISAAKLVAGSTNVLIQTADGVLSNKNSREQLIVALNEVAALTAQLVAALRVKASGHSAKQDNLERALQTVTLACKLLVAKVQLLISSAQGAANVIDYSKLTLYENKLAEMEQQVEILKLESALVAARKQLGEIRKYSYRDDDSDAEQ